MLIREATGADLGDVLGVARRAFGRDDEADLIVELLADPTAAPRLSLAAYEDGDCVGHILFTAVRLTGGEPVPSAILAPLAVAPEAQGRGCGTQLVATGLVLLRSVGTEFLFVLGHPRYYQRFGFEPAGRRGFEPPHPIAAGEADAWMVIALGDTELGSEPRRVRCADCLDRPELWRE